MPESGRDKTKEKSKKFNPPDYEDVLNYATERGRADLAKQFFDYFTVGNWKDSSGKAVISWKQKFVTGKTIRRSKTAETAGNERRGKAQATGTD